MVHNLAIVATALRQHRLPPQSPSYIPHRHYIALRCIILRLIHAFQSIIVFGVLTISGIILGLVPILGGAFSAIIWVLSFILWIVLMVKAYQGRKYKLPWAGDFAEKRGG